MRPAFPLADQPYQGPRYAKLNGQIPLAFAAREALTN